jgi:hypothetical protein
VARALGFRLRLDGRGGRRHMVRGKMVRKVLIVDFSLMIDNESVGRPDAINRFSQQSKISNSESTMGYWAVD